MSKTSKSNPEKGLRTVSIEFGGKQRTLKFGHSTIGDFEAEANSILRSQRAIEPGTMAFAENIVMGWLGNAKILSLALATGLKHEATKDDPITTEIVDVAIDSYIERGGSKTALVRAVITSYRYATDPSSVASLTRNWKISDEYQALLAAKEGELIDKQGKAIADMTAKTIDGTPSTESPNLS